VAYGNGHPSSTRHPGNKMFCGRRLGREAIPGSDGQCGPTNGPQCASCQRWNTNDEGALVTGPGSGNGEARFYCGRRLGREAIPGSDGQCGPTNGPLCGSCQRWNGRALINRAQAPAPAMVMSASAAGSKPYGSSVSTAVRGGDEYYSCPSVRSSATQRPLLQR
jgi:hypothetical protein